MVFLWINLILIVHFYIEINDFNNTGLRACDEMICGLMWTQLYTSKMSIISNVNLYLHDKYLLNGSLKSKSTSNLLQAQTPAKSIALKDGGMAQQRNIPPPLPTTISGQTHSLQVPQIITTSSSSPSSPAGSPLLQRSSRFLSGLTGNTTMPSPDDFRMNGRKRRDRKRSDLVHLEGVFLIDKF